MKAWTMLATGLLILGIVTPFVLRAYQQQWPDEGPRPLIVIATQGGGSPYTVAVDSETDAEGRYTFRFGVRALDGSDSAALRRLVQYSLTVVGTDVEGAVSCGQEPSAPPVVGAQDLDEGTMNAYRTDRDSPRYSATGGGISEADLDFVQVSGQLTTLYADELVPDSLDARANGSPLVHGCTIEPAVLWSASGGAPMEAIRSTLFAPQYNATTIDGRNLELQGLAVRLWVDRPASARLEESYPTATADSEGWYVDLEGRWHDISSFLFTEQPTWQIENRDGARFEQAMLLFGGILLGLALSLFQGGVSDLIDAHAREERSVVPPTSGR